MAFLEDLTLGIAPTIIEGIGGLIGAESNRKYNERMWRMNNEYNSMHSQVNRAMEAGINPNALFGNGMNAATSQPLSVTPQSDPVGQANTLLGSITTNALAIAQADKLASETDNNKYDLTWNKMTEKQRYESLVNMNDKTKADIKKVFSEIGVNDFNKDLQERTFRWFAMKSEAEIKVMQEQLNVLRNQSLDILKGIDLKDASIKQLFSSIALQNRQREFFDTQEQGVAADINLKSKQGSLVDEQKSGQKINNDIQKVVREYSEITGIPVNSSESQAIFALWARGRFTEASNMIMLNAANRPVSNKYGLIDKFINTPEQHLREIIKDMFNSRPTWTK